MFYGLWKTKPRKKRSGREVLYYLWLRFLRLRDNPKRVALGVAISVFINWLPLLGLHTISIILFCRLMGASVPAGLLTSLLGNPWTLPLMFWLDCIIGEHIVQRLHLSFTSLNDMPLLHFVPRFIMDKVDAFFIPALIGSLPIALACAVACYYATLYIFRHAKQKKA